MGIIVACGIFTVYVSLLFPRFYEVKFLWWRKIIQKYICQLKRPTLMLMFVCVFVYLKFIVPLENVSLIWRRYHSRWRAIFAMCSALMAIDQCEFYNVPPTATRVTLYNGHLRGSVTLSLNAERLTVELSLPVFTT